MRVGFVSTWKISCGIATYTEELCEGLVNEKLASPIVLAPQPTEFSGRAFQPIETSGKIPVEICWSKAALGAAEHIVRAVQRYQLDVVHFQHEDGLWPVPRLLLDVLAALKAQTNVKVLITLHTVHPYGGATKTGLYDALREAVDAIVVHTTWQRVAVLLAHGSAPVIHIPHGTRVGGIVGDESKGRKLLALPPHLESSPLILVFGFLSNGKNLTNTVKAYAEARARRLFKDPYPGLAIVGESKDDFYVENVLPAYVVQSGYDRDIVLYRQFSSLDVVPHLMAAAEFGVLNTTSTWYSASGQVHLYAAHGVPLAVADRPIYSDAVIAGAVPFKTKYEIKEEADLSAINALAALHNSPGLRNRVAAGLRRLAQETSWGRQAKLHTQVYEKLLGSVEKPSLKSEVQDA